MYSILSHLLLNPNSKVLWLDTDGTFDPQRALAIAEYLVESYRDAGILFLKDEGEEGREVGSQRMAIKVLDRLDVSRVFQREMAMEALTAAAKAAPGEEEGATALRMVVVDSITSLLGGEGRQNTSSQGIDYFMP